MTQSSQRFCLRWNNHQSNLLSVFDQLLQDESFVDVTLAVEGQFLRAHKMVLSACSPYFQTLFVGHPDKHPIVILKDVPFADMRSLLDFMYRGEVSVDQDRLSAFLKVAESLRIKGLTEVNEDKCDTQSSLSSLISNPPSSSSAPPPPDLHRIQLSQPSHKRSSTPSSVNGATSPYSQKRKRGRPRKLSESSDGGDESPDRDCAILDSDSKQLDSSYGNGPPDLLEVNMSDHPLNTSGALSDDGNESPERVISQEQETEDFCYINNIKREIDEPSSPDNKNSSRENNVGIKSEISNHQSSERCPADLPILHLIPKGELMNAYQKKEKDYSIVDSENNNIFMRHGVQTTSPVILNNGDINHHNYSPPSHLLSPTQNMMAGSGNGNNSNDCFSGVPPAKPNPARRRVRRRTACGNDPAEQLTEMSVRGLNLFRYASIDAGVYRCMECDKTGITKTFKNKYSFQRHAFLYHEGCQRKVFPCSICGKEFSRPDKMKNHLKTVHDYFVPKDYLIQPPPSIPYFISPSS